MAVDEIMNTIHKEISNGGSVENIEKDIFDRLSPYFNNKSTLVQNLSDSSMVSVYEFIIKYSEDAIFSKCLTEVLDCYSSAFNSNPNEVLHIIAETKQDFSERENMMWTIRQRTVPQIDDIYEKIMFYFEYIGSSLEISVKGIVHELYALIRIINRQSIDYNKICKTDFGVAINNILAHNCFEELLQIGPNNIKLSDWRNISNHNSFKINDQKITCTYGKSGTTFTLAVDEFLNYVYIIVRNSNVLNIARCIFVYDNIPVFSSKHDVKVEFREKMIFNRLKMSLVVHGFVLKFISKNNGILVVELQDLKNDGQNTLKDIELRQCTFCDIFKKSWTFLKVSRINIKYFNQYNNLEDVLWLEPIENQ